MAKMIQIELAHWIDPDVVDQMFTTNDKEVRRGHTYFAIFLQGRPGHTNTTLGGKYTAIQADAMMKRIANAQSKLPRENTDESNG